MGDTDGVGHVNEARSRGYGLMLEIWIWLSFEIGGRFKKRDWFRNRVTLPFNNHEC